MRLGIMDPGRVRGSTSSPYTADISRGPVDTGESDWPLWQRIGFRFAFVFLVCATAGLALWLIPYFGFAADPIYNAESATARLFARAAFGTARALTNSSAEFALVMTGRLLFALTVAVVWSILDRRRRQYRSLDGAFRVYLRYFLAAILLEYGISKIIPSQFPRPTFEVLYAPVGNLGRMRILWTMMGLSTPYEIFTGLGEATGAFLLLFRRTTTLGALLLVAVMSNVVLMNFGFEVPVKIPATVYLLVAAYLLIPDAHRLYDFFLRHRAVALGTGAPRAWPAPSRGWSLVKAAIILWCVGHATFDVVANYRDWHSQSRVDPVYGAWTADSFVVNGDTIPPLTTAASRWHRLTSDFVRRASVHTMDERLQRLDMQVDSAQSLLTLTSPAGRAPAIVVRYARTSDSTMSLDGVQGPDSLHVRLRREVLDSLPLLRWNAGWLHTSPRGRRASPGAP